MRFVNATARFTSAKSEKNGAKNMNSIRLKIGPEMAEMISYLYDRVCGSGILSEKSLALGSAAPLVRKNMVKICAASCGMIAKRVSAVSSFPEKAAVSTKTKRMLKRDTVIFIVRYGFKLGFLLSDFTLSLILKSLTNYYCYVKIKDRKFSGGYDG